MADQTVSGAPCEGIVRVLLVQLRQAATNDDMDWVLDLADAVEERVAALTAEHARLVAEQKAVRGRLEGLVDMLLEVNRL